MTLRRSLPRLLPSLLAALLLMSPHPSSADGPAPGTILASHGTFSSLQDAISNASDGDRIDVFGGSHPGPIVIDHSVALIGHEWPVIDGGGSGTVLKLSAPGIELRGFRILNSGSSLDEENAGISGEAPRLRIVGNWLENVLFGIYLRKADHSLIQNNRIRGLSVETPRRGDPIRVWYSNHVQILGNKIRHGRDVVLWYSNDLTVRDNEVSEGRYGLHFMYCDDAFIESNILLNNSVGAFLMYSRRLRFQQNTIAFNHGPSGYGVGLKDMDNALLRDNLFFGNRVGAHLDNSPREVDSLGRFEANVFAFNDIGVSLMPSVRNNQFSANSFIENQEQVAITGGGGQALANDWHLDGSGNYWGDYAGYDASGDGIGDVPYVARKLYENLIDRYPDLRLFIYSPAAEAINFAARAVPLVRPDPKLTDEYPLMQPPPMADLPPIPAPAPGGLMILSAMMIAVGLLIMATPSLKRSR